MDRETLVVYVAVALLVVSLLQSSFIIYKSFSPPLDVELSARATQGSFSVCLNHRPYFDFSCNTSLRQGFRYLCQLNVSDYEHTNFTYEARNLSGNLNLSISATGLINTTPTQDMIGNSTVRLRAIDGSGCDNAAYSVMVDFEVANRNDAPVFTPPMGPFEIDLDSSLRGIFIDDYFYDPDGDAMTFSHTAPPTGFLISILPTNEIIFYANQCEVGTVIFEATDVYNATGSSTPVTLRALCYEEEEEQSGGGGSFSEPCEPDWYCQDWDECRPSGRQKKVCIDKNGCQPQGENEKVYWRNCTYIPQCENGIQDSNEDGVDCGGPCPPCETCDDGILNNEEEEIDCGGPHCPACKNCADGIKNYGEEGVDCGGPCPPCPSCNDGIQNQGETGVDCGGPHCPACKDVSVPGILSEERAPIITVGLIVLIASVAGILILYRVFHRQVHLVLTRLMWLFMRRYAKQILLTVKQKDVLLERLAALEKRRLLTSANTKEYALFQEELALLLRELFTYLLGKHATIPDDAFLQMEKLDTTRQVKDLLSRHYTQLLVLEQKHVLSVTDLQIQLELFRERICSIAPVIKSDIARPVQEARLATQPLTLRLKQLMYNAFLALQFSDVSAAKEKYLEVLSIYEGLTPHQQAEVYNLVQLLFHEINYVASYTKKST